VRQSPVTAILAAPPSFQKGLAFWVQNSIYWKRRLGKIQSLLFDGKFVFKIEKINNTYVIVMNISEENSNIFELFCVKKRKRGAESRIY